MTILLASHRWIYYNGYADKLIIVSSNINYMSYVSLVAVSNFTFQNTQAIVFCFLNLKKLIAISVFFAYYDAVKMKMLCTKKSKKAFVPLVKRFCKQCETKAQETIYHHEAFLKSTVFDHGSGTFRLRKPDWTSQKSCHSGNTY